MTLWLGNYKTKLYQNGIKYNLNLFSNSNTIDAIRLLSSDDYTLKDLNGLYLITKEGK